MSASTIRLYMVSLFPSVLGWIWVVLFVALITGLNVWSLNSTAKVNFTLVVFAVVMIGASIVLAVVQLTRGMGSGTLFTTNPFYHSGIGFSTVLTGATVVCFSLSASTPSRCTPRRRARPLTSAWSSSRP